MRKILLISLLFICFFGNAQQRCGVVYDQAFINSLPPDVQARIKKMDKDLVEMENGSVSIANAVSSINVNDYILIPVVVHVVWNTAAQNISDAQICSQIEALNEDFARRNADASSTPSAFAGSPLTSESSFTWHG